MFSAFGKHVTSVHDAVRPGRYLVVGDFGMEQGSGNSAVVVFTVVYPCVARVVLDRVGEIPHSSARSANKLLHYAVFKESRLECTLFAKSAVHVLTAGSTRPDLRDITVDCRQVDECGFGGNYLPLRVVDERVRRNIEAEKSAVFYEGVFLQLGAKSVKSAGVEILLQLRRAVLCFGS